MSWEIKLDWDECPYLKCYPDDLFLCTHIEKTKRHRLCEEKNCPIKQ